MLTSTPRTKASSVSSQRLDRKRSQTVLVRLFVRRLPVYGWCGLAVNLMAWASSWLRLGPWNYTFFPLWLGFILFVDGLNYARKGHSLMTRSWLHFLGMFGSSSLFWWIFELLNVPVQNWHYVADHYYSPPAYFLLASLDFSTVLPAVMEIAELGVSFTWLRPRLHPTAPGPCLSLKWGVMFVTFGIVCMIVPWFLPRYTFGLVWLSLIFLLDPINNLAHRKSALGHLLARDWRFFLVLPCSALLCGFFWEMWNSHALPKWIYTIPFVNHAPALLPAHLFEMPLIGYTGYLPFALELFALYQFLLLVLRRCEDNLTL